MGHRIAGRKTAARTGRDVRPTTNNSEEITTKENWELVFDVDMNRIFGPVTMESMTAKINRDNEARLKAIAKKRAEGRRQPEETA